MLLPLRSCSLGLLLLLPAVSVQALRAQPAPEPQVRVLLQEGAVFSVRAPEQTRLRLRDRQGRVLRQSAPGEALELRSRDGWVEAQWSTAADAAEVLAAAELWIEPQGPAPDAEMLWLQQRLYRGRLQVRLNGQQLQVVNHVPLERYLPSVVGSEMPASWPLEALRAQAVAARTYALKGLKPSAAFDLKATVASQVYKGVEAETDTTRAAVAATRGLVLTYGSALINAVFHSSSGGSTESSGDLWPRQMPYLVSVPDFDHESPVRAWRQPLAPAVLSRAFAEIGGARQIEVLSTTPTGRVRQARVTGANGVLVLSGAQLRSRLGLKSTWVRFELEQQPPGLAAAGTEGLQLPVLPPPPLAELAASSMAAPPPARLVAVGRGFGHGVGMSQWGAYAMARRGESFSQILSHYYRGAQLRSYSELALSAAAAPGSRLNGSSALASSSAPRP